MMNPNVDTPMIKMMKNERMPPTIEVDSLLSVSLEARPDVCGKQIIVDTT